MVQSREVKIFECERTGCQTKFQSSLGDDADEGAALQRAVEHETQDALHIYRSFRGRSRGEFIPRTCDLMLRTVKGPNQKVESDVRNEQAEDRIRAIQEAFAESDIIKLSEVRSKLIN